MRQRHLASGRVIGAVAAAFAGVFLAGACGGDSSPTGPSVGAGDVVFVDLAVDGGLGMDYQALADEFDDTVFGPDVAYFGAPSDIDGNERVLVLLTHKVNELSASLTGQMGLISGFFLSTDRAHADQPGSVPGSGDPEQGFFRDLHQEASGDFPFNRKCPLAPTLNGFASETVDFDVQGGTGRYFTLASDGAGSQVILEVTDQTSRPLTAGSPQVTIIRTD